MPQTKLFVQSNNSPHSLPPAEACHKLHWLYRATSDAILYLQLKHVTLSVHSNISRHSIPPAEEFHKLHCLYRSTSNGHSLPTAEAFHTVCTEQYLYHQLKHVTNYTVYTEQHQSAFCTTSCSMAHCLYTATSHAILYHQTKHVTLSEQSHITSHSRPPVVACHTVCTEQHLNPFSTTSCSMSQTALSVQRNISRHSLPPAEACHKLHCLYRANSHVILYHQL